MMKDIFRHHETFVALIIIVLSTVIGTINPAFFTLENLFDLLKSSVVMGIFAIGVLIVLISGGIDISFPAIGAFCLYVTGKILVAYDYNGPVLVGFLIAGLLGLFWLIPAKEKDPWLATKGPHILLVRGTVIGRLISSLPMRRGRRTRTHSALRVSDFLPVT